MELERDLGDFFELIPEYLTTNTLAVKRITEEKARNCYIGDDVVKRIIDKKTTEIKKVKERIEKEQAKRTEQLRIELERKEKEEHLKRINEEARRMAEEDRLHKEEMALKNRKEQERKQEQARIEKEKKEKALTEAERKEQQEQARLDREREEKEEHLKRINEEALRMAEEDRLLKEEMALRKRKEQERKQKEENLHSRKGFWNTKNRPFIIRLMQSVLFYLILCIIVFTFIGLISIAAVFIFGSDSEETAVWWVVISILFSGVGFIGALGDIYKYLINREHEAKFF